jgi:hypothetical protein
MIPRGYSRWSVVLTIQCACGAALGTSTVADSQNTKIHRRRQIIHGGNGPPSASWDSCWEAEPVQSSPRFSSSRPSSERYAKPNTWEDTRLTIHVVHVTLGKHEWIGEPVMLSKEKDLHRCSAMLQHRCCYFRAWNRWRAASANVWICLAWSRSDAPCFSHQLPWHRGNLAECTGQWQ